VSNIKSGVTAFLKLWLFMFFSYLMVVLAFNLAYHGWIDLRRATLLQLLIIPFGQAIAFWFLTRTLKTRKTPIQ